MVGRPMLLWIIDHLSLRPCDTLWVAINKEIDDNFQVRQLLAKSYTKIDIQVVRLLHQTKGAAETVSPEEKYLLMQHNLTIDLSFTLRHRACKPSICNAELFH